MWTKLTTLCTVLALAVVAVLPAAAQDKMGKMDEKKPAAKMADKKPGMMHGKMMHHKMAMGKMHHGRMMRHGKMAKGKMMHGKMSGGKMMNARKSGKMDGKMKDTKGKM